jgi:hypothetical protein
MYCMCMDHYIGLNHHKLLYTPCAIIIIITETLLSYFGASHLYYLCVYELFHPLWVIKQLIIIDCEYGLHMNLSKLIIELC